MSDLLQQLEQAVADAEEACGRARDIIVKLRGEQAKAAPYVGLVAPRNRTMKQDAEAETERRAQEVHTIVEEHNERRDWKDVHGGYQCKQTGEFISLAAMVRMPVDRLRAKGFRV